MTPCGVPEHERRVFVYGTLMPGQPRWPALQQYASTWTEATASGHLWDTGQGYPAIRFAEDAEAVAGYVVTLGDERWAEAVAHLDRIEGEGVLYRRVVVPTSAGSAMSYQWLGSTSGFVALRSGWRLHVSP